MSRIVRSPHPFEHFTIDLLNATDDDLREVAETLGYDLDNAEERVKISTPHGTLDVPLVTLDEVTVLGKTAARIKTAIIPIPEEARINCVIGLTFLRNFTLGIDYSTGTLTLD